jgi:hypothetical protein|tara:strand:- start:58 stop:375 length:318 start_codon:yes stop_codon:yes gene_type:complete
MAVVWNVVHLDRETTNDGVIWAHWNASETETVDGIQYSGSVGGAIPFTPDSTDASFIAYASLTEADVIGWVKTSLGTDEIAAAETRIAEQITEAKVPSSASGVPW